MMKDDLCGILFFILIKLNIDKNTIKCHKIVWNIINCIKTGKGVLIFYSQIYIINYEYMLVAK